MTPTTHSAGTIVGGWSISVTVATSAGTTFAISDDDWLSLDGYGPDPQAYDTFDDAEIHRALARRPVIRDQGPPPARRQPTPRPMRPPPRRLSWLVEGRGR